MNVDIFLEKDMRPPDVVYEWIWELKYIKKADKEQLEVIREKGLRQLDKYVNDRRFADKSNLKEALLIFIGKDEYEIVIS